MWSSTPFPKLSKSSGQDRKKVSISLSWSKGQVAREHTLWLSAPFISQRQASPMTRRDQCGHLHPSRRCQRLPARLQKSLISAIRLKCLVACRDALYGNLHAFRRQKCLQPLHAFKRRQWPSFTFRRQKCLQSLHAFKGDNVSICISKTTMSSPQKLIYPFPLCFVGLDVLCLYAYF